MSIIYHAFHQSLNKIQQDLPQIKRCGYTKIQIPPMHSFPIVDDPFAQKNWYFCYQPLSFTIGNIYGSVKDLELLCHEAHSQSMKIIVDVCFNFIAPLKNTSSKDWTSAFFHNPRKYESMLSKVCQQCPQFSPKDILPLYSPTTKKPLWFQKSLPALDKSSPKVQKILLDFLHQLILCGVDGFRFDCGQYFGTDELYFFLINIDSMLHNPGFTNFIGFDESQRMNPFSKSSDSYVEIISEKDHIVSKYSRFCNIISFKLIRLLLNVFSTDQYNVNDIKRIHQCCKSTDVGFALNHDTAQHLNDGRGIGGYNFRTLDDMHLAQSFLVASGHSQPMVLSDYAFSDTQRGANLFANFCHGSELIFVDIGPEMNQSSIVCFKREKSMRDGKRMVMGFCLLNLSNQRLNVRKISDIDQSDDQTFYSIDDHMKNHSVKIQKNGSVMSSNQKQLRIHPRSISMYVDSNYFFMFND